MTHHSNTPSREDVIRLALDYEGARSVLDHPNVLDYAQILSQTPGLRRVVSAEALLVYAATKAGLIKYSSTKSRIPTHRHVPWSLIDRYSMTPVYYVKIKDVTHKVPLNCCFYGDCFWAHVQAQRIRWLLNEDGVTIRDSNYLPQLGATYYGVLYPE